MQPSTRRAALAVCAALLLVTAGCSGGTTTDDAPTTDRTSVATTSATQPPTTNPESPTASETEYPPGVAANGTLTNVSALVSAHLAATANRSMAFTLDPPDGSFDRSYAHGESPRPYYSTLNRTGDDGQWITEELYVTRSHGYARIATENRTDLRVSQNATPGHVNTWTRAGVGGPEDTIRSWISLGNYSVDGTVERDGRTFVELTADELSSSTERFSKYDGTVLVTREGAVHDVDVATNMSTADGPERRTGVSMTLDTDVEWTGPPSWVAALPNISLSIVEDGRAVEIRNTGDVDVPANTSFDIAGSAEPERSRHPDPARGEVQGTVTTDARLGPGDAVYVTANADDDAASFALHDEPTEGDYAFGYAGLTGGHGNVSYWLATGIEPWPEE